MSTASGVLSASAAATKKALATLMELGGSMIKDESIQRGPVFQIPEGMTYPEAAKFLLDHEKAEREEVEVVRRFGYRPLDGAVAVDRAIRKAFGTVTHKGTMGFFGPNPPAFIDVEVAHGETIQVPWGRMEIPAIPGCVLSLYGDEDSELGEVLIISAAVRRSYRAAVEGLFQIIEEELRTGSIYKGKAIDAGFHHLDLSKVDRENVVYAEDVMKELDAGVIGKIRYRGVLAEAGVDLKSAVLLHGTYGVGKTLFAYLSAQEAVANGMTFLQVRPGQDDLEMALKVARQYAPTVVFVEDVDTMASGEVGGDAIMKMLERFDGLRSKGIDIMAILTTNHPDRIHKGMVRPGRIDKVIEITAPDAAGIVQLCKVLIDSDLLDTEIKDSEWENVGLAGLGYIPAFIHEGCKRAIEYAIWRCEGDKSQVKITAEDIEDAFHGLRPQWKMMQDASEETALRNLDAIFTDKVKAGVRDNIHPKFLMPEDE